MASVKYSRLPMADNEERVTFDYSSAFSYGDSYDRESKYLSVFTYNDKNADTGAANSYNSQSGDVDRTRQDKLAHFMVMFAFYVVYCLAFPVLIWFSFKKIPTNQRLVIFRLGRLHTSKGPGVVFVLPILDRFHKVDITLRAFSVPPKQVITGDGGIIEVGAEIYFQVMDAAKSVTNVQNLDRSTRILVQTSLCNLLAPKKLSEINAERREISEILKTNSNETCAKWGVEISRVELSQIKVLTEPPAKPNPTICMPPGMFGAGEGQGSGLLSSAFAQLASALASNSDKPTEEVVADAVMALSGAAQDWAAKNHSEQETTSEDQLAESSLEQVQPSTSGLVAAGPGIPLHTPLSGFTSMPAGTSENSALPKAVLDAQVTTVEIIKSIQNALSPSLVQKVKATFQFEISGPGGGIYFLDLKNGDGYIGPGPDPSGNPVATLSLTFDDLQAMLMGDLQPFSAYMSGRLKVSGDVHAAMGLEDLGKKIRSQQPPVMYYS